MKFTPLFTLQLVRAGASSLSIPSELVTLKASGRHPSGLRALERHRLLLRPLPDGVRVLLSLNEDDTPFVPFDSLNLWFELIPQGADLGCVFDLSTLRARRPAVYRSPPSGSSTLILDAQPADPTEVPRGSPPLAWVEILGLSSSDAVSPRSFLLELPPRSDRWVYYVVTDRADRTPSISDSEASRAFDFDLTTFATPLASGANDRIAEALLAQQPQAKVHRLSSKRSPPADGLPLKGLRLNMADQTCIADLPPPPAHQWMSWPVPNNPSRMARYTVIRL
ncbi:MAG: hypothetical protein RLZZ117_2565 [Cyanobacteriota bacterium]|jgi:hypothetical protein